MSNIIDLDVERAKRGKLRGPTQVEYVMVQHDGHFTIIATDCGEEMLRHANMLRRIAELGDYPR